MSLRCQHKLKSLFTIICQKMLQIFAKDGVYVSKITIRWLPALVLADLDGGDWKADNRDGCGA